MIPGEMFEEVLASNAELDAKFRRRLEERRPVKGRVEESA
jgi:hypothetical protein